MFYNKSPLKKHQSLSLINEHTIDLIGQQKEKKSMK